MPPMHFQMEFAVPTVAQQAGLGRRKRAGAVDRGVVLREDDPALKLRGFFVCAIGQIDCGAAGPEFFPVSR